MRTNMNIKMLGVGVIVCSAAWMVHAAQQKIDKNNLIAGQRAFIDYRTLKPGIFRKITAADLPRPYATDSARNNPTLVSRPADAWPKLW